MSTTFHAAVTRPPVCRPGRLAWPALALALLLGYNLLATPGFFRCEWRDGHLYGSVVDIADRAAPILLTGVGMTLVIATGGVDLSVGAVVAIAAAVAATLVTGGTVAFPLVLVAALGGAGVAGLCNGALVAIFGVQPIVATLVLMVAGRGVAQLITAGQIVTFEHDGLAFLGGGTFSGLPFTVTIVAFVLLLAAGAARGTALGLLVAAIGNNESASRYAGVNVAGIKLFVYVASGLCAGTAGLIAAGDIKAADANNAGLYLELDAILAVVIGGTSLRGGRFLLAGTLLGGLLIQTLTTTILARGVPVEYTLVVKALVVLGVCLLQSDALRAALRYRWRR